ncbi:MAG: aspartate aminotransferase family protein [Bacteroidota bacterium]|nr:aspartate aminotransferase family protein [Bacteroidota bacterium]
MNADFVRHLAWTSDHPLGLEIERAEGPFLVLTDGRKLIDFISGIAVSSLGHRHPSVLRAIRDQLDRHLHVMVYGEFIQAPQVRLAKQLASVLPSSLDSVYFTMSGTEANEGALKLAKKYTGRSRMVAFEQSFHGDTHGSLSVTGRHVYQDPFRPLLPGVKFLPFGDFEALNHIDDTVACVIAEPIQGEGGMRLPPHGWFRALRARCTAVGALMVLDEIQTGFGRTGRLFAFEHEGIVPDILTLAKAMGGGMPLGAFVAGTEVMQSLRRDPPLSHVTTFGGHPVSCAAASATLQVLQDEELIERALWIEERVRTKLRHALITELRGRGAMLGMDLMNTRVAKQAVEQCLQRRVLLGWTLHSGTVIRIAPPLNIPEDTLDDALETITEVLDVVQAMDA